MKISLKAARVNAGMTQQEAAKTAGITPTTLRSWENGKSTPRPIDLIGLAGMYGVAVNSLFLPNNIAKSNR